MLRTWWKNHKPAFVHGLAVLGGSWTAFEASLGNFKSYLTPEHAGIFMAAVGVVGVLVHAYTAGDKK